MAKIEGKAIRFNGDPVDYVLLFDWLSGNCLGTSIPDALGNWSFSYYSYVNCGITYVADGCEPITHGSYEYPYNTVAGAILHYPFDNNTKDYSDRKLNGVLTGSVAFEDGRKLGTKAAKFTNGCVQTPTQLEIDSERVTISFWIKQVGIGPLGIIAEVGMNFGISRSFVISNNDPSSGYIYAASNNGYVSNDKKSPVNLNEWNHVVINIDTARSAGNEIKIYVNNVDTTEVANPSNDTSGIIGSGILYIGQRFASTLPINAYLQDFRVYNRTLTAEERTLLFTE